MAGINPFFNLKTMSGCLLGFFLLTVTGGCQTGETAAKTAASEKTEKPPKPEKPEKAASTLRLHMEENDIGLGVGKVEVIRGNPIKVMVQKTAFVDEGDIAKATVVDSPYGGHMIRIEYTRRGKMALQMATAPHPGRRVAVWSRWTEGRWLAAPVVQRGIEDGFFTFTPDCSREEAERIVLGLNNVAVKLENQAKPAKKKAADKGKKAKPTPEEEMFK